MTGFSFGNRTIPKLGFGQAFPSLSPFSFNITSTQKGPRFYGLDGTGSFYGANGYYRSYPVWSILGGIYSQYQYGGFHINSTGIFDVSALLGNPFVYNAQLSEIVAQAKQAPFAQLTSIVGGCMTGAGYLASSGYYGAPSVVCQTQRVPVPALTFQNVSKPFSGKLISSTPYPSGNYCLSQDQTVLSLANPTIPFAIHDEFSGIQLANLSLSEFVQCDNTLLTTYSPFWVKYISITFEPNIAIPLEIVYKGKIAYVDMVVDVSTVNQIYQMKVNPNNGNAFVTGKFFASLAGSNAKVWTTNVYSDNLTATSTRYETHLEDDTDDNLLYSDIFDTTIQQIPGGGFLLIPGGSTNTVFIVMPDLSGYVALTLFGPSVTGTKNLTAETITFDVNGNLWVLGYDAGLGTFQNVYSTVGSLVTINLTPPLLSKLAMSCRVFDKCIPYSG